jgi:alpha-methylacyl-CoA racemase
LPRGAFENDEGAIFVTVLSGVRVVELGGIGPGPFCGMLLGDMGADVVVIDRRSEQMADQRLDFLNRSKRSISLDLKTDKGRDIALGLIERAHLLIDPYRPGVAERLGIGPDECLRRNPSLIYGRVTGWGQDGPLAQTAGHDLNYIAVSGALDSIGTAETPIPPLNLVGDYGAGSLYLLAGLLAAYSNALRTGAGQVVDAAMCDGAVNLMTGTYAYFQQGRWRLTRGENFLDGSSPDYAVYRCSDNRFIAISPIEDRFYRELIERLGLKGLPARTFENRDCLRDELAKIFGSRSRQDWCDLLEDSDCCFAPVLSLEEAPNHPHLAHRAAFVEHDGILQPAPAPRFSRTPSVISRPPPIPGAHNSECANDWGVDLARDGEA